MDQSLLAVAGVIALIGVTDRIAWMRSRRADLQWLRNAITTEGTVVRIDERESYSHLSDTAQHSTCRVAIVVYRSQNGREYQIEASGEDRFVGSAVTVHYNSELPSDARPVEKHAYRGGCGFILIAIALGLAAKAIWW